MVFDADSVPDLSGKVALVTGGNNGLGFECVKTLSANGAHVIMAARNPSKARDAKSRILETQPDSSIDIVGLDLASLSSIKIAAEKVTSDYESLDILMNNAGLMALPEMKTEDGFEMQFGVNHLGHWALTSQLLPLVLKADKGRIVTTTSTAIYGAARIRANNPHMRGNYSAWGAYSHSKLANYYFAIGLHHLLRSAGSSTMSLLAHPGLSHTSLQVNTVEQGGGGSLAEYFKDLAAKNGMSAADGSLPQIRAAVDPRAKSGEFYTPRRPTKGDPVRRKPRRPFSSSQIKNLWNVSEAETGLKITI